MSFFEKSLNTLELPTVLEMLAREAVSDSAKELAQGLTPSADAAEVRRRLAETSAARKMMILRGSPLPLRCWDGHCDGQNFPSDKQQSRQVGTKEAPGHSLARCWAVGNLAISDLPYLETPFPGLFHNPRLFDILQCDIHRTLL